MSFMFIFINNDLIDIYLYEKYEIVLIRAVAGQRSSPDLCFATTSVKIYDP